MSAVVRLRASYQPDRSLLLVAEDADAGTAVRVAATSQLGAAARTLARRLHPGGDAGFDLRVDAPPWLHRGDLVRIATGSGALEGTSTPFAQVVGFLPVGGVEVVHPEAGAGVLAPEDLSVVPPSAVGAAWLARTTGRSGLPVPSWPSPVSAVMSQDIGDGSASGHR